METIKAPKGKVYQNKQNKYVCGKEIHLGKNDKKDNWQLINESEIPIRVVEEVETEII